MDFTLKFLKKHLQRSFFTVLLKLRKGVIKTKKITIIEDKDVNIGTKLILKDKRECIIQEIHEEIIPLHNIIVGFDTDIGYVIPDEVRKICR